MRRTPEDRHDDILAAWLAAEDAAQDERAETALAALFAALPAPRPPATLAAGVLAAIGRPAPWRLERLAALLLVATGAALWLGRWWLPALLDAFGAAGGMVAGGLAPLLAWAVALGAGAWNGLVEIARLALVVAGSPQVGSILAACGLLAALAAGGLVHLLAERSSDYVRA